MPPCGEDLALERCAPEMRRRQLTMFSSRTNVKSPGRATVPLEPPSGPKLLFGTGIVIAPPAGDRYHGVVREHSECTLKVTFPKLRS